MKKILFACDLDNTLIHSARHRAEGDICVEMLDGKEQSFMSPKAVELLGKIMKSERVMFLPVTTRSMAQFQRIEFPAQPTEALVCNGTILLKNGVPQMSWQESFSEQIEAYMPEMERLCRKYEKSGMFRTVRIVDGMFLFAARENKDGIERIAESCAAETNLWLEVSGRKLYWFPPAADKGKSVEKYRRLYGFQQVIAAGDSTIDYSMLEAADTALVPDKETAERINSSEVKFCKNGSFSEFILEYVLNL